MKISPYISLYLIKLTYVIGIKLNFTKHPQYYSAPLGVWFGKGVDEERSKRSVHAGLALSVIKLLIGTPPQEFNLIYSTSSLITWLANPTAFDNNHTANPFKSQSFIFLHESYEKDSMSSTSLASAYSDIVTFPSSNDAYLNPSQPITLNLSLFLMYYIRPSYLNADGEIGLGRHYHNINVHPYMNNVTSYSLMDALYLIGAIQRNIFGHVYHSDNEGVLYLGEFPSEIPLTQCSSNNETTGLSRYWNCRIDAISLKGNAYALKGDNYGMIAVEEKFIYLPEANADLIYSYGNYSKVTRENCFISHFSTFKAMSCLGDKGIKEEEFYAQFPVMSLDLNGHIIEVKPNDLFHYIREESRYVFLMVSTQVSYWILGNPVLKRESMMFDNDKGSVLFKQNSSKKSVSILNTLFWIMLIMFSSLLALYCLKVFFIRRKRRRLMKAVTFDKNALIAINHSNN